MIGTYLRERSDVGPCWMRSGRTGTIVDETITSWITENRWGLHKVRKWNQRFHFEPCRCCEDHPETLYPDGDANLSRPPPGDIGEWLADLLLKTDLADLPGRLLYSHPSTVRPGPLYVLGYNPGGDPTVLTTTARQDHAFMCDQKEGYSAYIHEQWKGHQPGEYRLQRRLRLVLEPHQPWEIPISNLIFIRSKRVNSLTGQSTLSLASERDLIEDCWPVHMEIIGRVRPACIITFGLGTFGHLMRLGASRSGGEAFACDHPRWPACFLRTARIDLAGHETIVLGLPHLSSCPINARPKVLTWAQAQIADAIARPVH